MEHMAMAIESTHEGKGCCMLLSGEPGIGKTRLLEEFISQQKENVKYHHKIFLNGMKNDGVEEKKKKI